MEMATFVAQSPDAPKVRQHIAAALLAIGMMGRSLNEPGVGRPTTADFHHHLATALRELEAAGALVPAD